MLLPMIRDAVPFWLRIAAPLLLAFPSLQPCVLVVPMRVLSPIVADCDPLYAADVPA